MACRDAAELGLAVNFIQGDMRCLEWTNAFDVVLIWFTTFGCAASVRTDSGLHARRLRGSSGKRAD
jgi:hypothetical protein